MKTRSYSLYPTGRKSLFVIFADQTSGVETYGAGRFLYTDGPDSNNVVILDFNKAYNPPCVFTKYATCPLPPKENQLKVRITAGEKNYRRIRSCKVFINRGLSSLKVNYVIHGGSDLFLKRNLFFRITKVQENIFFLFAKYSPDSVSKIFSDLIGSTQPINQCGIV
ncbi:MAG: DUF1684 domain-containing protein [Melioribacteraceae bacterium]|nr:DUF1684 domain-containing protein [Melioribacteraceae bacterium]